MQKYKKSKIEEQYQEPVMVCSLCGEEVEECAQCAEEFEVGHAVHCNRVSVNKNKVRYPKFVEHLCSKCMAVNKHITKSRKKKYTKK